MKYFIGCVYMSLKTYLKECFKWLPIGIIAIPLIALCLLAGDYPSDGTEFWTKESHPELCMLLRWLHNLLFILFIFGPSSIILIFLAVKYNIYFY